MTAIAPKMKKAGAVVVADPAVVISVACETWRFRAYVAFWGMCFFAITISRIIVKPILLAGPPADEYNSSCPPYSRVSIIDHSMHIYKDMIFNIHKHVPVSTIDFGSFTALTSSYYIPYLL